MLTRLMPVLGPTLLPALTVMAIAATKHPRTVYTSDSVAQQALITTWLDVGHVTTYVPPDTWVLKLPVYVVLELLPLSPPARILGAVLALNAITFVLLGLAARLLAPTARWWELTVPLTWLAALGGGVAGNRMLPNYRNIELGLCFLLLALAARYLQGERTTPGRFGPRLAAALGVAFGLAVFWLDDPYFEILVAAPLLVACLVWYGLRARLWGLERDGRYLWLAGSLAGSFVLYPVLVRLVALAGFETGDGGKTLAESLAAVWDHVVLLPPGVGVQLGVDDWSRGPVDDAAHVLLLVALALTLAASSALAVVGWRRRQLLPVFLGLHWPLVIAAYLLSWYAQDIRTSRYLVLIVYDAALATAVLAPVLRARRPRLVAPLAGLLVVAAALTGGTTAAAALDAASRPSPDLEYQASVVRAVRSAGADKGYAPFWAGTINAYLAGRPRTSVELVCSNHRLATRQWLSDTSRLTRPAPRVFVVWVPDALTLSGCSAATRDAQFGPPARVIAAGRGTQVLVYDHDIDGVLTSVTP
ncbi:hypothetical protein ACIB24_12940 [Spongisporangium articulatum]|uniref:Dolichyl-phosphate-mannose-protein mannosyltransferase n=1 Tax=Spongisporangium articulatum TaxID=3362603 RepID=A0ABW8ANP3_9ACTN